MAILVHGQACKFEYGASTASTAIAELIEMPEFGGAPEVVDTTHLTSAIKTGIAGLQDPGSMDFKFYYDATVFAAIKAIENAEVKEEQNIKVTLSDGASFEFKGYMAIKYDGGGVNTAATMTVTVTLSDELKFVQPTA